MLRWALVVLALILAGTPALAEPAAWRAQAARVSITRDTWGIAHIKAPTDADAVFGMIYAQAEDDFNRVETNYLTALGRTAEAEGEGAIWQDLRARLYVSPEGLKAQYLESPAWLRKLMDGWAAGLNHYLASHPQVKPKVITRFEPWMALSFTEGSIGGDIERIDLSALARFYGGAKVVVAAPPQTQDMIESSASNGIAISPKITRDGHALLLINPHTSFFFRSEMQVTSDEGLNVYGAATWGQFFIYQGFNDRAGWMHTTSGVDVVDEFAETIVRTPGALMYRSGKEARPVSAKDVVVSYRATDGTMLNRTFTIYSTHHGPIVREEEGRWIAFAMMYRPVEALQQSFLRTKARDYSSFMKVAELQANTSNNTLYADRDGVTAYLHPQFVPKRDDRFDYTRAVDGSNPASDWTGLHPLPTLPQVKDPRAGWVFNTNNWPYTAAGADSPKSAEFPRYMDSFGETTRGLQAMRVLEGRTGFTREGLAAAAYDPYLPGFATLIPSLLEAYESAPTSDPVKARLSDQVALLKAWDFKWSANSMATSLAVFWGEALWRRELDAARAAVGPRVARTGVALIDYMATQTSSETKLAALAEASDRLAADFGSWKTRWGEINRFQRLTGEIAQRYDDAQPSIAVPFTEALWGSLASFGSKPQTGTKRLYGDTGNSFVAVVEFGPRVRAVAINAGGQSGKPGDPHFNDQAERYARGDLREVWFHPDQVAANAARTYRPGE